MIYTQLFTSHFLTIKLIASSFFYKLRTPVQKKGLEVSRSRIDQFLGFFPEDLVTKVQAKIKEENDLNMKEFDPEIGTILNPDPTAT